MAAILKRNEQRINIGTGERMASAVGGGLLALYGWRRRSWAAALPLAAAGATLVTRAATGHSRLYDQLGIDTAHPRPVSLTLAVTVKKPRAEVYRLWRQLENLPRFMRHLQSVQQTTPLRSHWIAKAPMSGARVEWDAEIIEDHPDELIRWQSLPGSDIENEGRVEFHPAPGDRGTEVRVWIEYRTASGVRAALASLIAPLSEPILEQEIKRFKSVMEAGEAPTVDGQPSARAYTL
jgi:uncharacterized membrane protein